MAVVVHCDIMVCVGMVWCDTCGVVYDWQQAREARYSALKVILEDNIRLRDKAEERFQTLFEREIHRLHNGVREESEVSHSVPYSVSCMGWGGVGRGGSERVP